MSSKIVTYFILHIMLFFLSISTVMCKCAAKYDFFSAGFITFYGIAVFILFVYALVWQQILKKLPLNTAYANKAITIVWGVIAGIVLFNEDISLSQVIGIGMVVAGIITYSLSDYKESADEF